MEVIYNGKALEDIEFWKESGNTKIQLKISALINNTIITPFSGIGKPEALKNNLTGYWSRRINKEHRIIYKIINEKLFIFSLRGHYLVID